MNGLVSQRNQPVPPDLPPRIELASALQVFLKPISCLGGEGSSKISWMLSLSEAVAHIHSHEVFLDDITFCMSWVRTRTFKLRILEAWYYYSMGLTWPSRENGLDTKIEVLRPGLMIYPLSTGRVYRHYPHGPEDENNSHELFPGLVVGNLLTVVDALRTDIIERLWLGKYANFHQIGLSIACWGTCPSDNHDSDEMC
ncbi:hypothetical protein BDW71DRAFT_188749 [Aspergillus fruticulosus]